MNKIKCFNPCLDIRRFFVHFVSYAVPAFWASSLFIAGTGISHSQAVIRLQTTEQKTIYLDEGSIREGGGYITYETVHKFNIPAEILDDKNVRVLFDLAINEVAGDCNYQIRGLRSILFFPVDKGAAPFRFYADFVMTKDNPGSYGLLELNRACAFGK